MAEITTEQIQEWQAHMEEFYRKRLEDMGLGADGVNPSTEEELSEAIYMWLTMAKDASLSEEWGEVANCIEVLYYRYYPLLRRMKGL